jgi:DNA-binding response OmpR family regulator
MARKNVMVVDDDDNFRQSLIAVLKDAGYETLEAGDGERAVAIGERLRGDLDLMIVDLCLPGMNGFELIGLFTRRKSTIKIIAASCVFKDLYLEVAETIGAHKAISKPPIGECGFRRCE